MSTTATGTIMARNQAVLYRVKMETGSNQRSTKRLTQAASDLNRLKYIFKKQIQKIIEISKDQRQQ